MATDSPQYITSPGYENGHYDNFQACTWHAKVRTSKKTWKLNEKVKSLSTAADPKRAKVR